MAKVEILTLKPDKGTVEKTASGFHKGADTYEPIHSYTFALEIYESTISYQSFLALDHPNPI